MQGGARCFGPAMLTYLLRRIALTIPTFLALMFLTFVAIRLVPGDPVEVRMGERGVSPERLALFSPRTRSRSTGLAAVPRLCRPYRARRFRRLARHATEGADRVFHFVSGDAGAVVLRHAVRHGVGVPAGAIAAVRRGGFFDQALMTVSLFGYSMPIFWWGLVLIMFFSVTLGITAGLRPHRPHQLLVSTSRPASC